MEEPKTEATPTPVLLRRLLVIGLLVITVVWLLMGSIAGVVGGGLINWGKGAGGLGGWADLSMTLFSLAIGLAAAVATFRTRRSVRLAVAIFFTGILVGVGYLTVAHLFDPCDRGWWDSSSSVGSVSLCSPRGDISLRFHLLLHGTFGVISAAAAVWVYRRMNLLNRWR